MEKETLFVFRNNLYGLVEVEYDGSTGLKAFTPCEFWNVSLNGQDFAFPQE